VIVCNRILKKTVSQQTLSVRFFKQFGLAHKRVLMDKYTEGLTIFIKFKGVL